MKRVRSMKILYACQATGNGHISRARIMAKALKDHNIEVDWIFSGRKQQDYFDMEVFGDYEIRHGLTFITKNNKLSIPRTILKAKLWRLYKDIRAVNFDNYDLLINDFEPITAWASKFHKIKSLGLSNQSSSLFDLPFIKPSFTYNLAVKYYAPSKQPIGIHWQQFCRQIIPPVTAPNPYDTSISTDETLVYLPFYNAPDIIELLKNLTDYKFNVFHSEIVEHDYEHIICHKLSRTEFAKKMAQCNGIISNAGFELSSEALQAGKKLLLEPLHNQPEQIANADLLEHLGWAQTQQKLTPAHIEDWLSHYQPTKIVWPPVAQELAAWIKAGDFDSLPSLSDKLWAQVDISK